MTTLRPGDTLDGRYLIDRPIARGGMSTVYRCLDTRLGRDVAAKVMDTRYVHDELFLDRFSREARAMAQLSHPNLVGVYDFSAEGEDVFLIMELITGGTLRELLAERGPMPPHAAAAVMRSVLTGLAIAHRRGLVHRDIKPDNILINGDNTVKLADFGLVRAASESRHSTDQIVGTVAYLSPEQVDGSELTVASDVYSAGIVLFELLTGTIPFGGDSSLSHALARLHGDVPPPSSRIAGIPKLFDELVATATARDPRDRFTDADDFLAALNDVADDLSLPNFVVPAPTQSAAHRVAAIPTGITRQAPDGGDYGGDYGGELSEAGPAGDSADNGEAAGDGDYWGRGAAREDTYIDPAPERRPDSRLFPDPEQVHVPGAVPPVVPAPAEPPTPAAPAAPAAPYAHEPYSHEPWEHAYRPEPAQQPPEPVRRDVRETPARREIPEPETNRSRVGLVILLGFITIATAAVAVGGWWFGSGFYGEIPEIIRMPESANQF